MSDVDRFAKFRKMLNIIKLPEPAVRNEMKKEGFSAEDIETFFSNPSASSSGGVEMQSPPSPAPPSGMSPKPQGPPPTVSASPPPPQGAPPKPAGPPPPSPGAASSSSPPPPQNNNNPSSANSPQKPATAPPSAPPPKPSNASAPASSQPNPLQTTTAAMSTKEWVDEGDMVEKEYGIYDTSYGPFTVGENARNPIWFSDHQRARTEVPKQLLMRMLVEGEAVLGHFDVTYNMKPPTYWSTFVFYVLSFMTLGIYAMILQWCPSIFPTYICCFDYFRRGKIVITSKGRVICWEMEASRNYFCSKLDARVHYAYTDTTHVFLVKDLRQTTISFEKPSCYGHHKDCIELTFHAFNHASNGNSKYISTQPKAGFLGAMGSYLEGSLPWGGGAVEHTPFILRIISDRHDTQHGDGEDHGRIAVEEMTKLLKKVMETFSAARPSVSHEHPKSWTPDIFLPLVSKLKASGVKDTSNELENITLVDENNQEVTIPLNWMPLGTGEEIVSALGFKTSFSCFETFLCYATFGLYYCLGPRKVSALVLTTRRIAEIEINQPKGKIPAGVFMKKALTVFDIKVTSLFPGQVSSGYLKGNGTYIRSGLQSCGGHVVCFIPQSKIEFGQRMQNVHCRSKSLPNTIPQCLPHQFQGSTTNLLTESDAKCLPLVPGEVILNRFQGGERHSPCLLTGSFFKSISVQFLYRQYWCLFPVGYIGDLMAGISCLTTCGSFPLKSTTSVILTSNTLFYVGFNSPKGSCSGPFFIAWVPIRSMKQMSTTVNGNGIHENGICGGCMCKLNTAKISTSYHMSIDTHAGYKIPLTQSVKNKNWNKDNTYTKMVCVVGAVQAAIEEEDMV